MNQDQGLILTLMTFLPLLGTLVIFLLPYRKDSPESARQAEVIKTVAAVTAALPLALAALVYFAFERGTIDPQFVGRFTWIERYNIQYYIGIDGLSMPMVLLTALLSFICILASWRIDKHVKGYFALFLMLECGMMGVFVALDLFLFFIFWEVMLLPMYFLIGIWGGPRKEYAAIKFFLYTLFGSVFMLLAIIAVYYKSGGTFDMIQLANAEFEGLDIFGLNGSSIGGYTIKNAFSLVAFLAMFLGFAIKIPMFPFHTWLPDAHVEAPTAVSVILAGVLLKMGTYGILRLCFPLFPEAAFDLRWWIALFGVINILYGGFAAMGQFFVEGRDLKRLVAYSSISHMGYVLLGMAALTPTAMIGANFQMFAHGIGTAMLFLLVGVIYDQAHHRDMGRFGGLAAQMPVYAGVTGLAFMTGLGLPGLVGFIGEVLVLFGSFKTFPIFVVCAAVAVIITAAYMLWAYQKMFFGPLNEKYKDFRDMNLRELFTLVPLAILAVFLGLYPNPILEIMEATLTHLVNMVAG